MLSGFVQADLISGPQDISPGHHGTTEARIFSPGGVLEGWRKEQKRAGGGDRGRQHVEV
jgi:hypothetical protein